MKIKLAPTAKAEVQAITKKLGIKQTALSKIVAPNRNSNYLAACLSDGLMRDDTINTLVKMGADRAKMEAKDTGTEPIVVTPVKEPVQADLFSTDDSIRAAVMNGIIDAWLVIQKQTEAAQAERENAMIERIVAELTGGELHDRVQYMLFSAIDGALAKRGTQHLNDGLIPQGWGNK